MKKLFVGMISLLSLFFIFTSCEPEAPEDDSLDTSQYDETALWEGEQAISGWDWNTNCVKIDGIDPEKLSDDSNALIITYKSQRNPSLKISNLKDFQVTEMEAVRGDGSRIDDETVELKTNKNNGTVLCKVTKETMEKYAEKGFIIYGDGFTVKKVTITYDSSNEPGNYGSENPCQPPRELENDILVWDEGACFADCERKMDITFKNVDNYSSDANALRITYSTVKLQGGGVEAAYFTIENLDYMAWYNTDSMEEKLKGVQRIECSIGDGYVKTDGADDGSPMIVLNTGRDDGVLVVKIPEVCMEHYIKYGLRFYNCSPTNDYSIKKIALTKLEEETVWEGSQALSWDHNGDCVDVEKEKIPLDARAINISFKRTYNINDDASCFTFNSRWEDGYNPESVYCISGCDGFAFRYNTDDGSDGNIYINKCKEIGLSSCMFTNDQMKEFHDNGILLLGQDTIITRVSYIRLSATGPTKKTE